MRRKATLTIAALALAITAACGGGGGRPSTSEVSKALTKNNATGTKLPKKQADCFAKLLEKSAISDKALKALVAADKKFKTSKKDEAAVTAVATKAATACV